MCRQTSGEPYRHTLCYVPLLLVSQCHLLRLPPGSCSGVCEFEHVDVPIRATRPWCVRPSLKLCVTKPCAQGTKWYPNATGNPTPHSEGVERTSMPRFRGTSLIDRVGRIGKHAGDGARASSGHWGRDLSQQIREFAVHLRGTWLILGQYTLLNGWAQYLVGNTMPLGPSQYAIYRYTV